VYRKQHSPATNPPQKAPGKNRAFEFSVRDSNVLKMNNKPNELVLPAAGTKLKRAGGVDHKTATAVSRSTQHAARSTGRNLHWKAVGVAAAREAQPFW
jgi:hypothetical protein